MMLRLIAFQVVLATAVTESFSQDWFWKNPLPQGNDIQAMCSAGSGVLYAVGDFGTVIKSTNAGSNWFLLETSTTVDLHGVSFVTPDRGMVVGDAGALLQTTDGGTTWSQSTIAAGATLYGISLLDEMTGTVVGYPGIVLRTVDGGSTWQQQLAGGGDHLYALQFLDRNRGIIVGSQGVIFRTTNGGRAWGRQIDSTTRSLFSVSFPDSMNGFAVGENGFISRTTDGGKNWRPQQSGVTYLLKGVSFSNINNGIAVGENGTILTTTNGGGTWVSKPPGTFASFTAVHWMDATSAVAIGFSGVAFRTTDGGSSWERRSVGVVVPLYGVSVTNALSGIAVGLAGTVVTSGNAGELWTSRPTGTTGNLHAVGSLGNDTAIAVGENGAMIRTADRGLTWSDISLPDADVAPPLDTVDIYWYSGIAFSPGGNALVVGKLARVLGRTIQFTFSRTPVLRSTDRGTTWSVQLISFKDPETESSVFLSDHLLSVAFVDSNTAVAVGYSGRMLRTTDGGVTWDSVASGTLNTLTSVAFSKSNRGVGTAVGEGEGTVLYTTDGGLTWGRVQLAGETLQSISYGDATFAVATGKRGKIFYTYDGGRSWTRISLLGTNKLMVLRTRKDLLGVSIAGGKIILVGDGGVILSNEGPNIPVFVESSEAENVPTSPALRQNYPNPFNPETTIEFHIERFGLVHLAVYDLLGRQVATLVDEMKPPGIYRIRWNAPDLSSGTYILCLHQDDMMLSRKMLLIR